tara:strand:- start:515 stop:919 length:405 start_codon:yes stop_codon:yes gene_type:complete
MDNKTEVATQNKILKILTYGFIDRNNLYELTKGSKDIHIPVFETFVRKKDCDKNNIIYEKTGIPIVTSFIPSCNIETFMNKINNIPEGEKIFVSFLSNYRFIDNRLETTGYPNYEGTVYINKKIKGYYDSIIKK